MREAGSAEGGANGVGQWKGAGPRLIRNLGSAINQSKLNRKVDERARSADHGEAIKVKRS